MKIVWIVLGLCVLVGPAARAGDCKEAAPGLLAKAKITCEAARKTALAKVKNAKVVEAEIEEEDGKLVFSFDLKVSKKSGIDEVQVDALTGEIASVKHESKADEKREAAQDKAEKAKKDAEAVPVK